MKQYICNTSSQHIVDDGHSITVSAYRIKNNKPVLLGRVAHDLDSPDWDGTMFAAAEIIYDQERGHTWECKERNILKNVEIHGVY